MTEFGDRDQGDNDNDDKSGHVAEVEGSSESRLFNPFKNVGLVSTSVPCLLRYIHKRRENFIISCTGKSLATYVGQQLRLISSTDEQEELTVMAGDTYHVYTVGMGAKHISAWRRGTELAHTYSTHDHRSHITALLPFGENLISVDWSGGMCVFNIKTEELVRSTWLPISGDKITCIMHPLTFQNKIVIGSSDGLLHIWNINTNQLIHQFDTFRGNRINAIVQAPARGVLALALSSCRVVLFNIEYDLPIMSLTTLEEPISIGFRTDGHDVMVVGGVKGSITAWDLNSEEVISFVNEAHRAPVTGLVAFMSEPIFVSSAADNALRVWIFDRPDGGFRLLNSREGHRSPPTMARFHGEEIPSILTTGLDNTLRSFHLYNETYNRIISNFPGKDSTSNRGVDVNCFTSYAGHHQPVAEDILAFNKHEPGEVYTFSFQDCKRGKTILSGNDKLVITCAQITADQQWALVGFKEGLVHVYNLQSKRLKSSIDLGAVEAGVKSGSGGGGGGKRALEVMGIALSATESTVLVGTSKGISFHEFPGASQKNKTDLDWPARKVFSRPASNLAGIVLGNFEVLVCDVSTTQIVRRLKECCSPVTDATFSPDMKWVTASTSDGCILTWDVPTGNLIDIFRNFPSSITSLDYSPRGDFMVTTHADEVGIKLWVNRSVFEVSAPLVPVPADYYPQSPLDVIPFSMDSHAMEQDQTVSLLLLPGIVGGDKKKDTISLGNLPKFHWKELMNLSSIKARNKPAAAFKPKRNIPFMLSDLDKQKTRSLIDVDIEEKTTTTGPVSSLVTATRSNNGGPILVSSFGKDLMDLFTNKHLKSEAEFAQECNTLIFKLAEMGPSQLDLEIRSWDPETGGSHELLHDFISLAQFATNHKQHLQIIQSCLALFHKLYHKLISKTDLLNVEKLLYQDMEAIRGEMLKTFSLVEALIEYSNESLY